MFIKSISLRTVPKRGENTTLLTITKESGTESLSLFYKGRLEGFGTKQAVRSHIEDKFDVKPGFSRAFDEALASL